MSANGNNGVDADLIKRLTAGAGTQPLTLDAKVSIGGKEVSIVDLIQSYKDAQNAQEKLAAADKWRKNSEVLFSQDASVDQQREAFTELMRLKGYSQNDIEAHVNHYFNAQPQDSEGNEDVEGNGGQVPEPRTQRKQAAKPDPYADIRKEVSTVSDDLFQLRREALAQAIDAEVNRVLEGNDVKQLVALSERFNGSDGVLKTRETVRGLVYDTLVKGLKTRTEQARRIGSGFQSAWVAEEAKKAAATAIGVYKNVIPDPDKIGKAPETESEFASIVANKPVSEPTSNGGPLGVVETEIDRWSTDQLIRAAAEITTPGGQSKA